MHGSTSVQVCRGSHGRLEHLITIVQAHAAQILRGKVIYSVCACRSVGRDVQSLNFYGSACQSIHHCSSSSERSGQLPINSSERWPQS